MLASIGWLDDGAVGADAMEAAGRASGADDPAVRTALGIVERALAGEAAACLRRGWHGPGVLELRREGGFLHEDAGEGGARLVSGVIDRLVLVRGAGGAIERADVIDYKTDRPDEGEGGALSERVEHYRPQVRAYCRSVARMFGLAENAARAGVRRDRADRGGVSAAQNWLAVKVAPDLIAGPGVGVRGGTRRSARVRTSTSGTCARRTGRVGLDLASPGRRSRREPGRFVRGGRSRCRGGARTGPGAA